MEGQQQPQQMQMPQQVPVPQPPVQQAQNQQAQQVTQVQAQQQVQLQPQSQPQQAQAQPQQIKIPTAKEGRRTLSIKRNRGFIIVVITAIFAGLMLVLALFLIRSAIFNAQLLSERDKALNNFSETQSSIDDLRKKIVDLETNRNLEYLASEKGVECYDDKGELIREYTNISQAQSCSSLRTFNDALPVKRNDEKALAEVNLLLSSAGGVSLGKLNVEKDTKIDTKIGNLRAIPIEVAFSGGVGQVKRALQNLEKSIRQIDVRETSMTVQNDGIVRVEAKLTAYYTSEAVADIQEKIMKPGLNGVIWNSLNAKEKEKR